MPASTWTAHWAKVRLSASAFPRNKSNDRRRRSSSLDGRRPFLYHGEAILFLCMVKEPIMDLCNINEIKALLARNGFRFSKSMGQNFLIQAWVPEDTPPPPAAGPGTGVLEVGPGIGPLTRAAGPAGGQGGVGGAGPGPAAHPEGDPGRLPQRGDRPRGHFKDGHPSPGGREICRIDGRWPVPTCPIISPPPPSPPLSRRGVLPPSR